MKRPIIIFFALGLSLAATAQPTKMQKNMNTADGYRQIYRFEEAISLYKQIAEQSTDANALADAAQGIAMCENGGNMLRYASKPIVTGKHDAPTGFFFRFYDFNFGGSWAPIPAAWQVVKPSDSASSYVSPVFVPDGSPSQLFYTSYSPHDNMGWDIYVIKKINNTQWSAPERLSDAVNSPFDELFPYSPDGKTLYFASNGHFGMGGFDLYKSSFDETSQTWSLPENLGFPYSSPFDDLLYVPSHEGRSAYFASTREQAEGMIMIYRIVQETNPIKQSLSNLEEIQRIAALEVVSPDDGPQGATAEQSATVEYRGLSEKANESQKATIAAQQALDKLRDSYSATKDETSRNTIAQKILANESQLIQLQSDAQQANEVLYRAGEKLQAQGIALPNVQDKSTKKKQSAEATFAPQEQALSSLEEISVMPLILPKSEIDFTFRIADTSKVFFDQPAPQGLLYRIQLGVFSKKIDIKLLRGITPIFVEKTPTGKWLYAAGQFVAYNEAAKALPEVKTRNFRDATIVARLNEKNLSIKEARLEEAKPRAVNDGKEYYQVILGVYTNSLPPSLLASIKNATDKEIVKSGNNYIVGGFNSREEAEKVKEALQQSGFTGVKIELVKKK